MEINFLNTRSVIILVCLLQGVIFAGLLIRRGIRKNSVADFWLAALLLLLCSSLVTPFIGFAGVYNRNQWLTYFPFNIAYASGVCVYFYVLSLTNPTWRFSRRHFLLFMPSALYLLFRMTLFAETLEFKDWFDERYYVPIASPILFVTEFVWTSVLLILSIKHYRNYRTWLSDNFSDIEQIKFDWLRNFLHVFTIVFVIGGGFDFTDRFVVDLSYVQYFYFEIVLALLTYYLAVAGYTRFSSVVDRRFEPKGESIESVRNVTPESPTSTVGPDIERLKKGLEELMELEKPYLETQLNLMDLARKAGTNTTVLSQVINQGFGRNFNDFVNGYRVAEVKRRLKHGTTSLNLLGVALECGFNSKATFNRVFKKQTGISPKQYQSGVDHDSDPVEASQTPETKSQIVSWDE